jgi:hypothetical protein
MVIQVDGSSSNYIKDGNYYIAEGSVADVFSAFREGRTPIVKIRYSHSDSSYSSVIEEYSAAAWIYGESFTLAYDNSDPGNWNRLSRNVLYLDSTGKIRNQYIYIVPLTLYEIT